MQLFPERPAARPGGRHSPVAAFVAASALVLTAVVAFTARGGQSEPLKPILLASGEWSPYSGQRLPDHGVASAIVAAVLRRAGYDPTFRFMPWERAEDAARVNDANRGIRATFPYIATPERESEFYYSDPIMEIELSAFYNAERFAQGADLHDLADLAQVDIVPLSGYRYPAEVERLIRDAAPAADNVQAFNRLVQSHGPVVVIEATRVGDELLAGPLAAHADVIRAAPLRFSNPIHLIASRRNPNNLLLIRDFNAALANMRGSALAEIESRAAAALDAERMVLLQPGDRGGWIHAFLEPDDSASVLLPGGTRAVVERWSRRHLEPGDDPPDPTDRVRVRVLNGPQRGRQLFVDPRTVVLP